jgi:peptide/nickel transport system substrate-binding protein
VTASVRILLRVLVWAALALGVTPFAPVSPAKAAESHALAMHGEPALPAGFTHMPYANPDAPRAAG